MQPSLRELYLALHPGVATVPEQVANLSEELSAQDERMPSRSDEPPRAREAAEDKSFQSYRATVCKDRDITTGRWYVKSCHWDENKTHLRSFEEWVGKFGSFGWNESGDQAYHQIGTSGQDIYTIPAWTYQWHQWYYAPSPQQPPKVAIWMTLDTPGLVGLTTHSWFAWPK